MARADGPWRAVRGACSRICCRVASPRSIRLNSHWPDTRIVSADLGTRPRRAHPKANVGMEGRAQLAELSEYPAELARGSPHAAKISLGVAIFSTHAKVLSKNLRGLLCVAPS